MRTATQQPAGLCLRQTATTGLSSSWQNATTRPGHVHGRGTVSALAQELWGKTRMDLTSRELIDEAVEINHRQINDDRTLAEYRTILDHFASFLEADDVSFYTVKRRHVLGFLNHLKDPKGNLARNCPWCVARGNPTGRKRSSFSPSYRKKHLSALRFLYFHFGAEEDLPPLDPTQGVRSPRVINERQYTPSEDDVIALFQAPGTPRCRFLAYLLYYAPTRRQPVSEMRWQDLDLDNKRWDLVGKNGLPDAFDLHPKLVEEAHRYRHWQADEAQRSPAIENALSNPETAYVFLTRNGKRVHPTSLGKMLKARARRAGIALQDAQSRYDAVGGKTSKLGPHAMRRAWGTHAFNDPDDPLPLDVISQVYRHADMKTTRDHYIQAKPDRAREALLSRRLRSKA